MSKTLADYPPFLRRGRAVSLIESYGLGAAEFKKWVAEGIIRRITFQKGVGRRVLDPEERMAHGNHAYYERDAILRALGVGE